jgi:2-keto-4-pentenoate hydratase/2-oxohepta-3-ene-1,7-dioic acid hydratase in catechol pathway
MRYVRFEYMGEVCYGLIEGDMIEALECPPFEPCVKSGERFDPADVKLLAPCEPSKIVCVGLNYADHAAETGKELPAEPCLFLKPSTAVIDPEDDIVYPAMAGRVDYEAELALVIGRTAKDVTELEAASFILGYTCFNDVTARDLQAKDGQWTRAKGFDTFAPIGPWITDEVSPDNLAIEARVNGVIKQKSRTSQLIFKPAFLVSFVSRIMTLLPGDVIATGTPAGISGMAPGDVVEVEIEGIGILKNKVVKPGSRS